MAQKKIANRSITFKELLVVSRPFWWVNTAMPFVASYYIINGQVGITLLVGVIYFAFAYNLLMYGVNDIFDYESDIRNPRKVGVDGSVMDKSKHGSLWLWIMAVNVPLLLWLMLMGNSDANWWLLLMIFMALAYSIAELRFKEIPILDSFTSSFHYTSPFIYGVLLAGPAEFYWPAFLAFFIWVMANHAFGAIQDITPDREGGIASVATKLGASKTILFVLIGYCIAAVLPVIVYGRQGILATLLLLPYVVLVAQTLRHRRDDQAPAFRKAWKRFLYWNYIAGFVLTLALILAFRVS